MVVMNSHDGSSGIKVAMTPIRVCCQNTLNLALNRGLRDEDGQIYDIVSGAFFLCGAPADSDHCTSLTPEQIERYEERFHTPEMFWGMDGRIVCLPLEVD